MALDVAGTGHTLLWYALAQNDVDMQNHKLLNLDTSNLQALGAPPTIHPAANHWLHDWDNATHQWTATQPNFTHIAGDPSTGTLSLAQQRQISQLGTINIGTWQGGIIGGAYLATLNQIRPPIADVNMANRKLIQLANPINAQDAVTKSFMDNLLQGLNVKEAVRLATTTGNIRRGLDRPVDGFLPRAGDRILVKNEGGGVPGRMGPNGIYIASTGTWTRSTDCDTFDELNRAYCTVREGNVNGETSWVQSAPLSDMNDDKIFLLFAVLGATGPQGEPGHGVPAGGNTNDVLIKISPDDYDTAWVPVPGITVPNYAIIQTGQLNPTGTSNATGRMMGLGVVITPLTTGRFHATINGFMWNNNAAGAVVGGAYIGTGPVPRNGDPAPLGGAVQVGGACALSRMPANGIGSFSLSFVIGGFAVGTPVWIDMLIQAPSGIGVASIAAVAVMALEVP